MLLLVSDANVFIDIEHGDLTQIIFKLPYEVAVPDILFELELRDRHGHLLAAGLNVISLNPASIQKVDALAQKYSRPSTIDHSALALAIQEKCPLLTGDKALRIVAKTEGVEVHGTIWVVEQMLDRKLIPPVQAKNSFDAMKANGSRLPWKEVEKLLSKWELTGGKK